MRSPPPHATQAERRDTEADLTHRRAVPAGEPAAQTSSSASAPCATIGDMLSSAGLSWETHLDDPRFSEGLDRLSRPENAAKLRSEHERAVVARLHEKETRATPLPVWTARPTRNGLSLTPDAFDRELAEAQTVEALGVSSRSVLRDIFNMLVGAAQSKGVVDQAKLRRLLASMYAVRPQNDLEAMVAAQIAIIHDTTIEIARLRSGSADPSAVNALVRLSGAFDSHVESLKRLRSTGQQQVVVKRMTVTEGGQAIVGNVGRPGPTSGQQSQVNNPSTSSHMDSAPLARLEHMPALPIELSTIGSLPTARSSDDEQ